MQVYFLVYYGCSEILFIINASYIIINSKSNEVSECGEIKSLSIMDVVKIWLPFYNDWST